jgi:hypothetical protein
MKVNTNGHTSEKAAAMVGGRYDLVIIATARARELKRGMEPKFESIHSPVVTALLEVEKGLVGREYLQKV